MTTDAQRALNDETYLALGRFVVLFSGVLYSLEHATVRLVGGHRSTTLIEAALSDRTAGPIVSSFFSVFFVHWGDLVTNTDRLIMKALRRELDDLVRERNRLMHDAWMGSTVGVDPGPHALSRHRLRAHGAGADYEAVSYEPNDIERIAADAHRLSGIVNSIVWYHDPNQRGPELQHRFHVVDGKVARAPGT